MVPPPPDTDTNEDVSSTKRRVSKKLWKKRKEEPHTTMELPERLREAGDEGDEDVIPHADGAQVFMNMNQSIFGLIAAAGSTVDFNDRFEGQSSDEAESDEDVSSGPSKSKQREGVAKTQILKKSASDKTEKKHRRKISEHLLRSLPQLPRLATRSKSRKPKQKGLESPIQTPADEGSSSSPNDEGVDAKSPTIEVTKADFAGRVAPVMSRIIEARAEMASRPSFDLERSTGDVRKDAEVSSAGPSALAQRLKDIFEFDESEEVIEEYPCWLLQSVLLQGYLYITTQHICFFAYLPKKPHEIAKSGYLFKSGKRNPKYSRFWFRLKGDVLAYYTDASNLYFPHNQIDLRYAISASVTDPERDGVHFSVVTDRRTYHFKADSAPSAKEWVRSLQRVIFRSHNDGDSVKISLPIANVLDIEDSQMLEFADTCKIRVIDNDDTYAIDEYFFSFFSFGKEAINVLKILVEDAASQQTTAGKLSVPAQFQEQPSSSARSSMSASRTQSSFPGAEPKSPKLRENVKATLSPLSPLSSPQRDAHIRASSEHGRGSFDAFRPFSRRSMDFDNLSRERSPKRSFSASRARGSPRGRSVQTPTDKPASSDSYVQSIEEPSLSNMVISGSEDPSASQILKGSEVFHSPTLQPRSAPVTTMAKQAGLGPSSQPRLIPYTGRVTNSDTEENADQAAPSTPTLQNLAKMGTYPLQRAGAYADYLNQTSRRLGNLLATESMGYVEKVSGMWKGGHKHYQEPAGLRTDDEDAADDEEGLEKAMERFRAHFALPETETLQATYFGYMIRVLPLYGKIYISDHHFCFRSLLPGTRTKFILPIKDIETVEKESGFRLGYSGLVVVIRGHEEVFFEFNQAKPRDDCAVMMLQLLEAARYLRESSIIGEEEREQAQEAIAERDALTEARLQNAPEHELKMPQHLSSLSESSLSPTILFDDPKASFLNFKPSVPLRITCLTIGSRGDVQPYIALCKELLAEGHKPRIATHIEFKSWIERHGIEFRDVAGDPSELMRLCIQNGTFTWAFLREATSKFRGFLDELLTTSYAACYGSDILIESPSAMAGIHIAEALQIPYFRAFTMPWTRTRAYPHAFVMPGQKMGGGYNYLTYVMFDNVFWKATAKQVNQWRMKELGLQPTNLEKLQPNKVPFLYNFSPAVVPPPLDYSDWIRVTGYWFLDEGLDYKPPDDLRDFLEKARKDGKKVVYVGFGSIIVSDPGKMTQEIIEAVQRADVRCILSKGWSERSKAGTNPANLTPEPELPPEIFPIKAAPHDWLFAQCDAVAHHGGSGTTGASLRAGKPTVVRPFFGDQFFFGARIEDLGVGICLKKWGATTFGRCLWEACHDQRMITKAKVLGETIRKDNGVETAIQCIYRDLDYARSLIQAKKPKPRHGKDTGSPEQVVDDLDLDEDEEESWTFIEGGGDVDPDLVVKKGTLNNADAEGSVPANAKASGGGLGGPGGRLPFIRGRVPAVRS